MADRPLTTGEGTTADLDAISRRWYMGYDRGAHDYTDAGCRVLAEHGFADVAALLAECSRLREQLDAARQALERFGSHDAGCARYRHDFKVRFRNAEPTCLCGYDAARAAAATPDTPAKDSGGAPTTERPDARENADG